MADHGLILSRRDILYDDLTELGTVVIKNTPEGLRIYVDGFKFHDAHSCRLTTAKALAWARDVCNTAVHADSLVPGGVIVAVADLPDEAKKALES